MSSFQYDMEFIAGTKNNQADFLPHLPITNNSVKFSTSVEFVNLINFVKDINVDISNLKIATQKDIVLNTIKEFVKFRFPNINKILDPNVKEYF